MRSFKKIGSLRIKNCELNFKKSSCFMYNLDFHGITQEQLAEAFNGRRLLVYEFVGRIPKMGSAKTWVMKRVCPWCKEKDKDILTHVAIHNKDLDDLYAFKIQKSLYSLLLKKIRKGHYFATAYTNTRCQYCVKPLAEGREGLCSVPESARNKVQSFRTMRFNCDGFNRDWLENKNIIYIIL